MKTFYYSEVLKKYFNTEDECVEAEKEYEEAHAAELKAKEDRANKAKAVEQAYKDYLKLRNDFINEFGSYHMTLTEKDLPEEKTLFDLFDSFFF